MKRKRIIKSILTCMLIFAMSVPTYAHPLYRDVEVLSEIKEINSEKSSRINAIPKGRLISSASLQISDEGNGLMGVYADTLCHTAVKQIYLDIYLEVWIESSKSWRTVEVFNEEWNASDYPEGSLSMVQVSFDLEGLTRGLTYRLRGYHVVKDFGTLTEILTTSTSGVPLG